MKPIGDIYRDYKIMPQLATHQMRVAGMACAIIDALEGSAFLPPVHRDETVSACLLHDMGNILKFDLTALPEFLEPEGLAYWEGVKAEYAAKYGSDEHAATSAIAGEVGVSALTREYIEAFGFSKAEAAARDGSIEKKICCYADQRVAPYGVVSLSGRMEEARVRYAGRSFRESDPAFAARQFAALGEIERQIFAHAAIMPDAVTDDMCKKYFQALEHFALV